MSLRLAVIADIHYGDRLNLRNPGRRGLEGARLFTRVLRRLAAEGWPDAVILGGDLIDCAGADDLTVGARLDELADILASVPVPAIVIPGNHDLPPEEFYRHVPPLPEYFEIGGARVIPFLDPGRPGWNAERLPEDFAKFDRARAGFAGPLIALQHVPLFPSGTDAAPYGYLNGDAIIRKMHETGCVLSISGHHHSGSGMVFDGRCSYLCVPALCESPFSFARVELGDDGITRYTVESFGQVD